MTLQLNSPYARDVECHLRPVTNFAVHDENGPHIFAGAKGIYDLMPRVSWPRR